MKKIVSLMLVFAFLGCGVEDETGFTSLDGASEFQESLETVVNEVNTEKEKIGRRKNKKGESVRIEVGGKDLHPKKEVETAIFEVDIFNNKQTASEKIDILFYAGGETKSCLQDFSNDIRKKGFLSHLDDFDWQVGVSLFAKNPRLESLENHGRKLVRRGQVIQVLKSDQIDVERAERLLLDTLSDNPVREYAQYDPTRDPSFKQGLPAEDFMESLDQILSDSRKKPQGELYVIVFDYEHFPYYTQREWKKFYKKHPSLNLVLLSSRRVTVSNFSHVSDNPKFNFEWLPKCNREGISQAVVDVITKK